MNANEQAALFKQWLEQYTALMARVARAYTNTHEDGEDLIQEILLQLWRSLSRFEGRASPSTWIYRVALNTALAWRRSDTRRRQRYTPLMGMEDVAATGPDAGVHAENQELIARLYAAIRSLSRTDAALVLLYLDDLGYREIAEVLGISESNVGVKLNRAKKQLADFLKEGDGA